MSIALMYHDVVPEGSDETSGFSGKDAGLYKITPALFEEHLSALVTTARMPTATGMAPAPGMAPATGMATATGTAPATGDAIGPALPAPPAPPALSTSALRATVDKPALTFDDGGASALATADILERRGLRGSFFVTTNYIGARGFMDERAIRELARRGHVVGSHSCSHPLRMGHCAWPHLVLEWRDSRRALQDILGEAVTVASVPGGDFAPQVAEAAARAGYTELFTSEPSVEVRHAFGLKLRGRFTVQKRTTAATVAALAAGEWLPRARQAVIWNAKKITKRVGGERYLQLRKLLLDRV